MCAGALIYFYALVFMLLAIFTLYGQTGTLEYQAICCVPIRMRYNIWFVMVIIVNVVIFY